MKKIKRIIALALATVMMMAMSITAFAEETHSKSTIKITNLENGAVVEAYTMATVNYEDNDFTFADWTETDAVKAVLAKSGEKEMSSEDVATVTAAFKAAGELTPVTATANESGEASLEVPAGLYFVKAYGTNYIYNVMVVKAYDVDAKGNYKNNESTLTAKGSKNVIEKEADDKFVKAGETVKFTITTTIPNNVHTYKVYDKATNLTDPTNVVVTVNGDVKEIQYTTEEDGTYVWDFSAIAEANYGKEVVITYSSNVIGADGYENQTYNSTPGSKDEPKDVVGLTAKITLTKTDDKDNAITADSAEFNVTKGDETLKFELKDGVYVLSTADTASDKIATGEDGTVTVAGLDEGTYHFTETKAPQGYSINPAGVDVEVKDTDTAAEGTRVVAYTDSLKDSTLISLPFTGGMGTTIFTVLGVAIMAIAAALYFATKKSSRK